MKLQKYRWSKVYESAEEELVATLQAKGITAERWTAEPHEEFPLHRHDFDKRLWCVDGGLVVSTDHDSFSLQAGDTLDLPAGTDHNALVGLSGCACFEAHL